MIRKKHKQYKNGEYVEDRGTVKISTKLKSKVIEVKGKKVKLGEFFDEAGVDKVCGAKESLIELVNAIERLSLKSQLKVEYAKAKETLDSIKNLQASI